MEISDIFWPLETMKTQLKDMTTEQLRDYVSTLSEARRKGPEKVKRSKATGAPTKGKATNPITQLEALLAGMGEEEKAALLKSLEEDTE